jgi:hypothetical protein
MTILSEFIHEIAVELDGRAKRRQPGLPSGASWLVFVKLLTAIDRDDTPVGLEIREKLERRIVSQTDVRYQDRCRTILPLMLRVLPPSLFIDRRLPSESDVKSHRMPSGWITVSWPSRMQL